jgi:hypothetical protein
MNLLLYVIGGAAIMLALAYASYLIEQRRSEEMAALASELGWRFDASKARSPAGPYHDFRLFNQGHSREVYNTITGAIDVGGVAYRVRMGDFTYRVTHSTGKSSHTVTYKLSYVLVALPFGEVPDLELRLESARDKLIGALGFGDISFESDEFSRRFHVTSSDKRFAYAVVHPRMMEFLMRTRAYDLAITHGFLCLSTGRDRWSPTQFKSRLRWLEQFFGLWPDWLTDDLKSGVASS